MYFGVAARNEFTTTTQIHAALILLALMFLVPPSLAPTIKPAVYERRSLATIGRRTNPLRGRGAGFVD
jgi:hypothetical protein